MSNSYFKIPIKDVSIDRELYNRAHAEYPQVGDYWHEMYCPYFMVLEVLENHVIICEKTKQVDNNHWTFDLDECKLISKEKLEKRVKYSTMDKFVADVVPRNRLYPLVDEWRQRFFVDRDIKLINGEEEDD